MFATKVEGFRRSCHNPADTAEKTVNDRLSGNNFDPVTLTHPVACHRFRRASDLRRFGGHSHIKIISQEDGAPQ